MITEISYGGWAHCYRLANADIEAVVTTDVGPRILRFGKIGGPNEFAEYPDQLGKTWGTEYKSYGGHRLWIAPEDPATTYYPDNNSVTAAVRAGALVLTAPVERGRSIQKELELRIDPTIDTIHVRHRIRNCGASPLTLAAWALSVMAPGGAALLPQEEFRPHPERLLPVRPLALWSYTAMNDPRWDWGAQVIRLRQDPAQSLPQKIGARNGKGWVAYRNGDRLFVKTVAYDPAAVYPDFGSNVELFVNGRMLELETLSPLVTLPPGALLEHDEHWFHFTLPERSAQTSDPDAELEEIERLLTLRSRTTAGDGNNPGPRGV